MQNEPEIRICKQCLLRDFDEKTYREQLLKVLLLMDKDTKAEDTLYEQRLSICTQCEKLMEGTCLACGCYVELRAAAKKNRCPDKKW